MPIYEYKCESCGREYEVIHRVQGNEPLVCSSCSGKLKKIISRPTLLKNTGIYLFDRKTGRDIIHDK